MTVQEDLHMPLPTPTDWLNDPEQVERFKTRMKAGGMPRRQFVALMSALGAAAAAAACGGTTSTATAPASSAPASASTAASASASASGSAAATSARPSASTATGATPGTSATPGTGATPGTTGTPSSGGSASSPALKTWPTGAAPTDLAADQTFNQIVNNDPSDMDFNKNLYGGGSSAIYERLLRYDPDFQLCAGDAVSYEVRQNGAQYVFKMNPAAVWNNGDPVNAETYIYSFTRQLDPATAAAYAGFLTDIKNGESFNTNKGAKASDLGLRAIDPQTLEITLERPAGYFPILAAYTAATPAHKPSVDKFGDKWTEPSVTGAPVVGNGIFTLTKWERGKSFTLERNERYAVGPKPLLKTVNYTIVPTSAGLAPYEGGNLDYLGFGNIPAGELPRLQADPQLKNQLNRHSQSGLWYLVPEVDKPPFDNLNVRKALQRAIDREQLGKVIQGLGEPAYSLISPDLPYHIDPAKFPEFKNAVSYNPAEAKKLLDGTPYAGGRNWPGKITMSMRDEGAVPRTAAEYIQKSLRDNLGLEIEFDIKPSTAFNAPMFARQYQLIFIRWYMDYPDPNNFYKDVFNSRKSSGKRQAWSNAKFDDLILTAASEPNPEKRAQLYRDCEKILLIDDAAYSPLYYGYAYALFKPRVGGIPKTTAGVPQPDWNIFVDMKRSLYIKR
jgi:ABC-type oligopeptide transport system substrate-binding subunit